jgi:hypothetical protein
MTEMRKLLPHKREGDAFRGVTRPSETRWTSLGEFTEYVACHQDRIRAFLADRYPDGWERRPWRVSPLRSDSTSLRRASGS